MEQNNRSNMTPAESDKARHHVKLANEINRKLSSLMMPKAPGGLGADFSDVYFELEKFREAVDAFLKLETSNWEHLGESLIEIRTSLQHMNWHVKSSRRGLDRLIDYCYEQLPDDISKD